LNKQAIKVAETSIAEAEEHLRVAQAKYRAGLALEADVYRAEVYLAKAKESRDIAINNLNLAKRRLEVLVNTKLSPFDIEELQACPIIEEEKYMQIALKKRADLKALDYEIKALDEQRKVVLSDNLPQIFGFAEYSMYSRNYPFENQQDGYTAGIKFVWRFDTGLTVLKKASAIVEQKSALLERYKYLQDYIALEMESAISDYRNALAKLRSADERVKHAKEVVRVMQTRYSAGLVRMVDLLDAQTQLDLARFERIEAIKACHEAFAKLLFASSSFEELL
jgi:outer membrane protein TolC